MRIGIALCKAYASSMSGVLERLDAAGKRRKAAAQESKEADAEAREAILAALRAGIPQADVARRTGYHRNSIAGIAKRHDNDPLPG